MAWCVLQARGNETVIICKWQAGTGGIWQVHTVSPCADSAPICVQPTVTEELVLRGCFQTLPIAIYGWALSTRSGTEVHQTAMHAMRLFSWHEASAALIAGCSAAWHWMMCLTSWECHLALLVRTANVMSCLPPDQIMGAGGRAICPGEHRSSAGPQRLWRRRRECVGPVCAAAAAGRARRRRRLHGCRCRYRAAV